MSILDRRLTRREMIILAAAGLGGTALSSAVGCQSSTPAGSTGAASAPGAASGSASPVAAGAAGAIKRGGVLRVLAQNDFTSMWPLVTQGPTAWMCYDPLVRWRMDDKGKWAPKPALAESWEMSDSKAVFKIRQGVKFHDGSDVDADVVAWNVQQWMQHPKSMAKPRLQGVDAKNPAQVLDKYTVQINLTSPASSLLVGLGDACNSNFEVLIVSKAGYDKLGETGLERTPAGSGPFRFVKWESGNQLTVEKNPDYWDIGADGKPLPYLDGITYRIVPDDSVRVMEMRTGNGDLAELVPGKDLPTVKNDPNLVYVQSEYMGNTYRFMFNSEKAPFGENVKLRQAVEFAIDRESVAKALGMGVGVPMKWDYTPGTVAYDEKAPYYWYDAAKAKQLVQEAGFPNGVDITLTVIARELDQQMAEMMKSMLDAVGIRVTIEALEKTAWNKKVRESGDFQMGTQRTNLDFDGGRRLLMFWLGTGGAPYTRAKMPDLEKLAAAASGTYDEAKQRQAFLDAQKVMYDSAWWGYVWMQPWNYVMSSRVRGFPKDPWSTFLREHELWLA